MKAKDRPTVEYLRQCFREENGHLFWLVRPLSHFRNKRAWASCNTRCAGKEAGSLSGGRCQINSFGTYRYVIIWAMHHGEWPSRMIDHKNRDATDDRIENLRLASFGQNSANSRRPRTNTSGYKGVSWSKTMGKWGATIDVGGKTDHIGYFDDPAEAHAAYVQAAREAFGEFACDGMEGGEPACIREHLEKELRPMTTNQWRMLEILERWGDRGLIEVETQWGRYGDRRANCAHRIAVGTLVRSLVVRGYATGDANGYSITDAGREVSEKHRRRAAV